MTLRMDLAYVAMAALALTLADIAAAHAAMRSCNAEPQRCRYSSDGRQYFYASPHQVPTGISPGPGGGVWGCGATDGVATGRTWGHPNKASASYGALAQCAKRSAHGGCHIVSCSGSVHTYAEAHATWFVDAHQ